MEGADVQQGKMMQIAWLFKVEVLRVSKFIY